MPVVGAVDLLLRHGRDLLDLDGLDGLLLRSGLRDRGRGLLSLSRGLDRLDDGLLSRLGRSRRGSSRRGRLRHDLLGDLGRSRDLGDLGGLLDGLGDGRGVRDGRRLRVLELPGLREGRVALGVLGADALDDDELLGLLAETLEGLGHGRLAVLDVGRPGERAESRLTLGLLLAVRLLGLVRLRDLRLLRGHAALLADGRHDGVDERELVGEREVGDLRDHLGHGGHFVWVGML